MSDPNDDPTKRQRDIGEGYPEESPSGTGIDASDHAEDDVTPEPRAPGTSTSEDSAPSHATGNPRAAGG
jgi:hypothetical protein